VSLASAGASSLNVAVKGAVNALPTVSGVPNQTVLNSASTVAVNFTGTANKFSWTNNTPAIGLPASGSGTILHRRVPSGRPCGDGKLKGQKTTGVFLLSYYAN
jgi:hypothetical protein